MRQRLDWLRLIRSENIGPRTFRSLIGHFGDAGAALAALPDLARRGGAARPGRICPIDEAEREIAAARRFGVSLIASCEPDYPQRLRMIDDAPPLHRACAAGSRRSPRRWWPLSVRATPRRPARNSPARSRGNWARPDIVIASGLARGIDAAAHRATIESGTVAVLAGGHDNIYPPEHGELLEQLLDRGAAITEMPLGWEPRAHDFPRRNRLISGLVARRRDRRSGAPLRLADHRAHGAGTGP